MKTFCLATLVGVLSSSAVLAQASVPDSLIHSNDGTANYGYEFRLPAARGRYQPHLGLSYNSAATGGVAGVGWSLNVSYIERNDRSSPRDATGASRNQLWLVIDGSRRLLFPDPADTTRFRPDIDSGYTQVRPSTDELGRTSWTMVDGIGNTYQFKWLGTGISSSAYSRWYLRTVVDVDGNTTDLEYTPESAGPGTSGLLNTINYNNFGTNGQYANQVSLTYKADPTPRLEVINATLIQHSSILDSVSVRRQQANVSTVQFNALRTYQLGYLNTQSFNSSPVTARQLLLSIAEMGTNGSIQNAPPTTFAYADTTSTGQGYSGNSWYGLSSSVTLPHQPSASASLNWSTDCANLYHSSSCDVGGGCSASDLAALIDIDGDGLPDMVWSSSWGTTPGVRWARNISAPGAPQFAALENIPGSEPKPWGVTTDPGWHGTIGAQATSAGLFDLDGDGKPDLVTTAEGLDGPPADFLCTQPNSIEVRYNRPDITSLRFGSPTFAAPVCVDLSAARADWVAVAGASPMGLSYSNASGELAEVVDLTGDGVPDLVIATSAGPWKVYPGIISFQPANAQLGLPDVGAWGISSTSLTYSTGSNSLVPLRNGSLRTLADMNGDGLLDLVVVSGSPPVWSVLYNQGLGQGFGSIPGASSTRWAATSQMTGINSNSTALQSYTVSAAPDYLFNPGGTLSTHCRAANQGLGFSSTPQCYPNPQGSGTGLQSNASFGTRYNSTSGTTTCSSSGSQSMYLDLDGDGVPDFYQAAPNTLPSIKFGQSAAGPGPADILTSITTPMGALISLKYVSSVGFGSAPGFHAHPVVSQVTISGPAMASNTINRWYANPAVARAWDDPSRVEQLGFLNTYSLDTATSIVTAQTWGNVHEKAGRILSEEVGPLDTTSISSTFVAAKHTLQSSVTVSHDVKSCQLGTASAFPSIVLDLYTQKSVLEALGSALNSSSGSDNCNYVDAAGNVLQSEINRDWSDPAGSLNVYATYPNPASTSVLCKNCVLETWAKTSPTSADLFRRRFHYDAPAGFFDPAPVAVTTGHLNYVEELVSGNGRTGVFEVSPLTSYNANGTVASVRKDYAGQRVSTVLMTSQYDAFFLQPVKETASDTVSWGSASTPLVSDVNLDPVTGAVMSRVGPYLSGTTSPGPTTFYQYDRALRIIGVGRQDQPGGTTTQLAMMGYIDSSGASPASSWAASFASFRAYPVSGVPTADDVNLAYTYYDGAGRPIQVRTRVGSGVAADPSARVAQSLAPATYAYLVKSELRDGAGRTIWSFDPYYSGSQTFEDLGAGSPAQLSAPGFHVTGYLYDRISRPVCALYAPLTSLTGPANLGSHSATAACASTAAVRATPTTYGSGVLNGRPYLTVSRLTDDQSANPPTTWPTTYTDASGVLAYASDAGSNFTGFGHDALGRTTSTTRYAGAVGSSAVVGSLVSYDLKGRVVQQVDDAFHVRSYSYNSTGQLIEIGENPNGDVPEGIAGVQMAYGSLGRLEKKWSFNWTQVTANCGPTPNSNWSRTPGIGSVPASASLFTYDAPHPLLANLPALAGASNVNFMVGRLASMNNDVANIAYSYDSAGRLNAMAEAFSTPSGTPLPGAHGVQYLFRPDGGLLQTTVSSPTLSTANHVLTYYPSYDSAGRVVKVDDGTTTYWSAFGTGAPPSTPMFDALGRLSGYYIDNGAGTTNFSYDVNGSNQLLGYGSSVTPTSGGAATTLFAASNMRYTASKLTGYSETVSGNNYSFGYDPEGRLSSAIATSTTASPLDANMRQSFNEGDSFYLSGTNSLWNFHSVTKQIAGTSVQGTYNYLATSLEQLTSINYSPAQLADALVYDVHGRLSSHTDSASKLRTFSYDAEGHLIKIVGAGTENLAYGPSGSLVRRTLPDSTVQYYVGGVLTINNGVTGLAHVLLGGSRVATVSAGSVLYYHRDRLGSIVGTSTKGGLVGAKYRYDVYGLADTKSGETTATASELGYTGALKLSEGLVYLNARVYDPKTRRFLQPDNVDSRRYTYVGGDPVNKTDPSGHTESSQSFWHSHSSYNYSSDAINIGMDGGDY